MKSAGRSFRAVFRWRGVSYRACTGIAHYNFSASLPKLWALPRGWALPRPTQDAALRTHKDAALDPAGGLSAPDTPDQRVTLSLETPPSGFHP